MPSNPDWVEKLKPTAPSGGELLSQERAKSKIETEKLTTFIHGEDFLTMRNEILEILQKEPVFEKSQNVFAGRIDRFKTALARAKRLRQLASEHGWSLMDHNIAVDLISEPMPYGLHGTMFLLTLYNQCDSKQAERWLSKAMNYEIIGCYAQTELGHGSNVQGLETTATWLNDKKCFKLHSPSLTACKWWVGSLGRTANHAVVMAQLIVNGKRLGPHPFVVQIRDMETHKPLENVHIGDIGPKFGYNTMDNGFLLFNNLEIPHISMLAKHSRVDPETNQYIKPKSKALAYSSMTWVRSMIVWQSGGVLARGVTIAVRYCAVRRQFQDRDSNDTSTGETQVLDYTMVSYRLFTLLAAMYGLHFAGKAMTDMYEEANDILTGGGEGADADEAAARMADLHVTSCGLKSLASTTACDGLEAARRACGGHGYSSYSGIGPFYADYLPNITWEGDNYMLTQQVANYLLKTARSVLAGEKVTNDTQRILSHYSQRSDIGCAFDVLGSDEDIVSAFAWRAAFLTFESLRQRDDNKTPWNDLLVTFYRLSKAHSQYMLVKIYYDKLNSEATKEGLDEATLSVLWKLFRLYSLHVMETESGEFFASAATTVKQLMLVRTSAILKLLKEIRPHALRLVDAWDFPDFQMDSSLGRSDGAVYEDMFHRASRINPLNDITIDPYPDSDVLFKEIRGEKVNAKL